MDHMSQDLSHDTPPSPHLPISIPSVLKPPYPFHCDRTSKQRGKVVENMINYCYLCKYTKMGKKKKEKKKSNQCTSICPSTASMKVFARNVPHLWPLFPIYGVVFVLCGVYTKK
jgi:hypothetical protein